MLVGVMAWLGAGLAHTVKAREGDAKSCDNQPLTLSCALDAVCRKAGFQLIYSSKYGYADGNTKGSQVLLAPPGPLPFDLPIDDAIRQLLRGTELQHEWVNAHTITVVPAPPKPAGPQPVVRVSKESIAQITVADSQLHGRMPMGSAPIIFDREHLVRIGATTLSDVVRHLTSAASRGPTDDTRIGGNRSLETIFNRSYATGINLRSLGAGATLVLLNGQRIAPGAGDGRFADISTIPLASIGRIEVLPEGASAIYGADAIGGVVNIVLRDGYEGAETLLQFGSSPGGGPGESLAAQTVGRNWETGTFLLSAEHYTRDALAAADRPATAFSDLRRFGGDNFDTLEGNPGTLAVGGRTWAIPRGQDGRSLEPEDFVAGTANLHNRNAGRDALPQHHRWSLVGTLKQKVGPDSQIFADVLVAQRRSETFMPAVQRQLVVPKTNAFYVNPLSTDEPVVVSYNFGRDLGPEHDVIRARTYNAAVGAAHAINDRWVVTSHLAQAESAYHVVGSSLVDDDALSAALSDSNPETAFNPFGDGSFTNPATLIAIRTDGVVDSRSRLLTFNTVVEGSPFQLRDRPVGILLGAELRRQTLHAELQLADNFDDTILKRDVASGYLEAQIPLGAQTDLSLAARNERYSDFGAAMLPRAALKWSPVQFASLRASWSKSLKAPDFVDLDEDTNGTMIVPLRDPTSPSGTSPALIWIGRNADLREETATSWTIGADVKLNDPGLTLAVTYFDTSVKNRVEQIDFTPTFLIDSAYAGLVTRDPSPELRQLVCSRARLFVDSPDDCRDAPVAALVDMRLQNTAVVKTRGIDAIADLEAESSVGTFAARFSATYLFDFRRARFPASPPVEFLSTQSNPIDLRLHGFLAWQLREFGLSASIDYTDGYRDTVSIPNRRVSSWTTVDLRARYGASAARPDLFGGLSLSLGIENLFDADPPFFNNPDGIAYDPENADVVGRMISFRVSKTW